MTDTNRVDHQKLRTVTTIEEVRAAVAHARRAGRRIGFVPTMGALHAGHVSLMLAAKQAGAYLVASVYVNPTQFGPKEDFRQYPRTLEADQAACAQAGVDLIFAPRDEEMYPPGDQTRVRPGRLAESLCGACRPGHFEGVCTVVAKLFNIVQPDIGYFGQKDAQQAVILRRMVKDLCMPVRIEVCPLIREPDGLAMSSRNARLSPEERQKALCLYRALCLGRDRLSEGERSIGKITAEMHASIVQNAAGATVDYLSIVDPETLEPLAESGGRWIIQNQTHRLRAGATVTESRGRVMLAGAVRIGATRLIDNILVDAPGGHT